jgi:hypothetical protein
MDQWLPENWWQALTRLQDDIHRTLDPWLTRQRAEEREMEQRGLPVLRRGHQRLSQVFTLLWIFGSRRGTVRR